MIAPGAALAQESVDQQFVSKCNNGLEVTRNQIVCQTFTVGVSGTLTRVDLVNFKTHIGLFTADVVIDVRATTAGVPSDDPGAILAAATLTPGEIPRGFGVTTSIDISEFDLQVAAGDVLALCTQQPDQSDPSRYAWWGTMEGTVPTTYEGGHSYLAIRSAPWLGFFRWAVDFGFRTWVDPNNPPVADAGLDVTNAIVDRPLDLDGTNSSDPDLDPLTYWWEIVAAPPGSAASLDDPMSQTPSFVPDVVGDYTIELVVNDGVEDSAPDNVVVTVITAEEFAAQQATEALDVVEDLPSTSVSNGGNQNALENFIDQVLAALESGDLEEACHKLDSAIERTDGCALQGAPDLTKGQKDYIVVCEDQLIVYDLLTAAWDALCSTEP